MGSGAHWTTKRRERLLDALRKAGWAAWERTETRQTRAPINRDHYELRTWTRTLGSMDWHISGQSIVRSPMWSTLEGPPITDGPPLPDHL